MNRPISIAIFTSIRSEYGLLKPLIKAAYLDKRFDVKLLVGGAHLLDKFGHTIDEIKADGFPIDAEFPFLESDSNSAWLSKSLSNLQRMFGEWIALFKPDYLVVLGDRFELLPIASTALIYSVPLVHISGGESTEGAIDNQVRHAVSKMAHVHFPATEFYRQNLMRMGEESWRIEVSGEPGLDDILNLELTSKEALFLDLGIPSDKEVVAVTFHPETIDNDISVSFLTELFEQLLSSEKFLYVVTAANFDEGGNEINEFFQKLATRSNLVKFYKSLGKHKYYSLLKAASAMLGNSSSGLVEAQSFNLPVLNIGKRQLGRLANPCVLNVPPNPTQISSSLSYVVGPEFKKEFVNRQNIYGGGDASSTILNFLDTIKGKNLLMKRDVFN